MDLVSACALRVSKLVWRPGHGGFAFTVVCKATFELQPELSPLAEVQDPVIEGDVHADSGSLLVASELVPFKKRPELLLSGHAYAPEGSPTRSLVARLTVGEIDKAIQVVGDRSFGPDGRLSDAERFAFMPLIWDRAAGGPGTSNPAGRPMGAAAQPDAFGRVPAPNLLPAGLKLGARSDGVTPVNFGPIAPLWPSRAAFLHRHAAGWDPERCFERALPLDLDFEHFNAAALDQQRSAVFAEETLQLKNLHPRFVFLSTRLAPVTPVATVERGAGPEPLQLRCDTMILDTDRGLAMLVWRGHVLLEDPDRPGCVRVTGPEAAPPSVTRLTHVPAEGRGTLAPGTFASSFSALPFSAGGEAAPKPPTPPTTPSEDEAPETKRAARARLAAVTMQLGDAPAVGTLAFGFVLSPAAPLPFSAPSVEGAPRRDPLVPAHDAALPFRPSSASAEAEGPLTTRLIEAPDLPLSLVPARVPYAPRPFVEDPPEPAILPRELPAPPPLLGPLASSASSSTPSLAEEDTIPPPPPEASAPPEAPVVAAEPELSFDAYPPERCGAIAAHLACEASKLSEILGAAALDEARWARVHEHWLGRIRAEASRSRTELLSRYDEAYVRAIEEARGPLALGDYARLAEAAERHAVAEALGERGLPEGAWPHLHRVWIGRMVKDLQVARQVRAAIDGLRAAS